MSGHEAYEEYKLYTYLEHRWDLSMAEAERGHHELAVLTEQVEEMATGDKASPAFAAALRAHHDVLEAHLDLEEELVIPALLALTPEEFERYARSDITTLLRRRSPSFGGR